jgi:hypothetical protein
LSAVKNLFNLSSTSGIKKDMLKLGFTIFPKI